MSWRTAFIITLLALLASLYWGYTNLQNCEKKYQCAVEPAPILPAEARGRMDMYTDYLSKINITAKVPGDTLIDPDGKPISVEELAAFSQILRGFHIDHCMFASVIKDLGPDANVYAMLGITPPSKGKSATLDLVFIAKPGTSDDDTPEGEDDEFFDFTSPCPNSCP